MGTTPNRGYPYPSSGSVPDAPVDMRLLAEAVDTDMTNLVPVGAVIAYAGTTAPTNWLLCDGTGFDSLVYPLLATVLGTPTTPNLVDRFVKGVATRPATKTGGSRTITAANMPSHNHSVTVDTAWAQHAHFGSTYTNGDHTHTINLATRQIYAGGGANNGAYLLSTERNRKFWSRTRRTDLLSSLRTLHGVGGYNGSGTDYEQPFYTLLYIVKAK